MPWLSEHVHIRKYLLLAIGTYSALRQSHDTVILSEPIAVRKACAA